jgi:hypothetical protein
LRCLSTQGNNILDAPKANGYSAFRTLAGGLFTTGGTHLVFVLRTYLDASSADGIAVVGGYVSSIDQWDRLEPDWNRILEEEGVLEIKGFRHLHMKDLVAGQRGFEGWTEARRKSLLSRLGTLINVRTLLPIARGVSTRAYQEAEAVLGSVKARMDGTDTFKLRHGPLTFCLLQCLNNVAAWCVRNSIEGPQLAYFLEAGDPNKREVIEIMDGIGGDPRKVSVYRFAGWAFGNKRLVPLQAADWIAYETQLYGKRSVLPRYGDASLDKRHIRASMQKLMDHPSADVAYHGTRDALLAFAKLHLEDLESEGE